MSVAKQANTMNLEMRQRRAYGLWHLSAQWLVGNAALALLTLICFRFGANSTTVALLYLIVIVLVSLRASFFPAAFTSLVAYISLDYFFTAPLFTLGMNQTLDFVAPIAYVTTALVITQLMSKVRKSIEDQKRAEEALRKSQAEMALVTRVMTMGELAASIAHEINQPLTAIVNNSSACLRLLATDPPDLAEAREAVSDIIRDGNRASEIIRRIRALLRKTETAKVPLDVNQAIEEVKLLIGNEATAKGVMIRMDLAANLPRVLGDRIQVQQVILNLVMNGIESIASVRGGSRELFIRSRLHNSDKVLVAVQDTGAGIDHQDPKRIFDAFYTTKQNGLGLGLAISRSILEHHGGELWAMPNEGPGMTFHFTLLKYEQEQ
jgi:C4-dicarboxylate-specific signal transduction histidine kinase